MKVDLLDRGIYRTVDPIQFTYRGRLAVVPMGYRFDTFLMPKLVDRFFPSSLFDLRLFAVLNILGDDPDGQFLTAFDGRQETVAEIAVEALKANGGSLFVRWNAWAVISWRALLLRLVQAIRRERSLDSRFIRYLIRTILVTVLLAVPLIFPFIVGRFLPHVPLLGTALGALLVALIEFGAASIPKIIKRPRNKSLAFAWVEQ